MVAADVVVWDSASKAYVEVHATTTNQYASLLTALRGGMGGNYGVVTAWYMKTFQAPQVRPTVVILGPPSPQLWCHHL